MEGPERLPEFLWGTLGSRMEMVQTYAEVMCHVRTFSWVWGTEVRSVKAEVLARPGLAMSLLLEEMFSFPFRQEFKSLAV